MTSILGDRPKMDATYHGILRPNVFDVATDCIYWSEVYISGTGLFGWFPPYSVRISDPELSTLSGIPASVAIISKYIKENHVDKFFGHKSSWGPFGGRKIRITSGKAKKLYRKNSVLLPIEFQSYFLFVLDQSIENWHFNLSELCITSKSEYNGDDGEGVLNTILFFDSFGEEIPVNNYAFDPNNLDDRCKFVVIGLKKMGKYEKFKLNMHVNVVDGVEIMPTIFDPDIQNNGNEFPP